MFPSFTPHILTSPSYILATRSGCHNSPDLQLKKSIDAVFFCTVLCNEPRHLIFVMFPPSSRTQASSSYFVAMRFVTKSPLRSRIVFGSRCRDAKSRDSDLVPMFSSEIVNGVWWMTTSLTSVCLGAMCFDLFSCPCLFSGVGLVSHSSRPVQRHVKACSMSMRGAATPDPLPSLSVVMSHLMTVSCLLSSRYGIIHTTSCLSKSTGHSRYWSWM